MTALLNQALRAHGVAQVIVVLRAAQSGGAVASASEGARLAAHFAAGSGRGRQAELAASLPHAVCEPYRLYPNLGVLLGSVDKSGLAALRAAPEVSSVVAAPALRPIRPQRIAAARLTAPRTWGIEKLRAHKLWDQGVKGAGVLIGHLDTGADGSHPALRQAIAHFAEFDLMGRKKSPDPRPRDTDQHGTHTAASIAGRPVSGKAVGVAPEAKLASAIVIEGGDAVARVLGGMDWALELEVRVLSMSLGFPGWWPDFQAITRILRRKQVLPVFAVGNEYAGSSRSPGNYAEAVSVGACDRQGRVAAFSSSDRFQRNRDPVVPDLVAPGVDVISARPGGGWQAMDGTSMATPHIAGLAALLIGAVPKVTLTRLEKAIFGSCLRPSSMSPARGGRGIPDALRALEAL